MAEHRKEVVRAVDDAIEAVMKFCSPPEDVVQQLDRAISAAKTAGKAFKKQDFLLKELQKRAGVPA